jgi:hypothetical protein
MAVAMTPTIALSPRSLKASQALRTRSTYMTAQPNHA